MRLLVFILGLGLVLRVASIYPANVILGFDQARDLFDARKIILDHDLRIVGPEAGNNPNLHHGVAFLYFILPPIFLGGGNPFWVSLWLSVFNLASALVLSLFAKSLFRSRRAGLIAAFLAAVSYYFVEFAGWISNPSPTLLTVPLAFYGLWEYREKKTWGLPLSLFFLGLSIQFELFFLYLIPVFLVLWFVLKLELKLKLLLFSLIAFSFSLSTMIATEVKFRFTGVLALLGAGKFVGGTGPDFLEKFANVFSDSLWPQRTDLGAIFALLIVGVIFVELVRKRNLFLLIYLLSPASMLVLGYHNAPWFLVGLAPAIILAAAYALSKIKNSFVLLIALTFIGFQNINATKEAFGLGQPLLEPDPSSIVSTQLAVIDYTYQKAGGAPFAVNTVTNPLYINAVWAWNYRWYGEKKYGYFPSWLGGDQIPPYDVLPKSDGQEKLFFLIVDTSPRIPDVHKILAQNWAEEKGQFLEEKDFGGIKVSMWKAN